MQDLVTTGTAARQAIQKIAGQYGRDDLTLEICTVEAVYTAGNTQWTCDAKPQTGINTTIITGIQLTGEIGSNGFIRVPAVGSTVIVAKTIQKGYYVWLFSEVDQFLFYRDMGNGTFQSFTINSNGIQFNDGTFGGLVEVAPLVAAINILQTQLQNLKSLYDTHTHAISGATAIPTTLQDTDAPITLTERADIENTNITHGIPLVP